jgi:large subunit ribosomal protein L10
MKSKQQKQEELVTVRGLLAKSQALVFTDVTKVTAEDLRRFRRDLRANGADFLVIKKRLLTIALKEKMIDADLGKFKTSIGTIFSREGVEGVAAPAFQFFSKLEVPEGAAKDVWARHLLGAYDVAQKELFDGAQVIMIGKLPPREVLLGQLLGMLAAPIRSFLYILNQRSKQA